MADQARLTIVLTDQTVASPVPGEPQAAPAPASPSTGAARPAAPESTVRSQPVLNAPPAAPAGFTAAEAAQFEKTYGKDARQLVEAQIRATTGVQQPVSEPTGTARTVEQSIRATAGPAAQAPEVHRAGTARQQPEQDRSRAFLNALERAANLLGVGGFAGNLIRTIETVRQFQRILGSVERPAVTAQAAPAVVTHEPVQTAPPQIEPPRVLPAAQPTATGAARTVAATATQTAAIGATTSAGASTAAGAATGLARTAAAAATSLGPVAIVAGAVVVGFGLLAKATQMLYQWMSRSAQQLEIWHGGLATANAQADIIRMQAERRRALMLGDDLARFQKGKALTGSFLSDITTGLLKPFTSPLADIVEGIGKLTEKLDPKTVQKASEAAGDAIMRQFLMIMFGANGMLAKTLLDVWNRTKKKDDNNNDDQFDTEIKKLDTLYESLLNYPHPQARMPANVPPGEGFGGLI